MATEIHRGPAAERQPLNMQTGMERLSEILSSPGEPDEAEAQPEPVEVNEPEAEAAAEPAPEPTEPEMPTQEAGVEDTTEGEEPGTEAKAEPDPSGDEPESIELEAAQLAGLLGLEERDITVNDDGAVRFRIKVDGEQSELSLSDIREGFRLAKISDQRLSKLSDERQAFEKERDQTFESLADQHNRLADTLFLLENEFVGDFESIDWARLREEDATEYNARRLDFEDRRRKLEEQRKKIDEHRAELMAKAGEELQKRQTDMLVKLGEEFEGAEYTNSPAWDETEAKRLKEWIMGHGFSAEEIGKVHIWQLFKWARDSMLRQDELKRGRETERKVKKLPKVIKPGQPKTQRQVARSKVSDLKSKQRKSGGDLRSSTELIRGIMDS